MYKAPSWEIIEDARKALPNAIVAMGTSNESTLMVVGQAADLPAGVVLACEAIDDGRAEAVLDALVRVSQEASADEPPG